MQQWVENFSQGTFSIACTLVRKYVFHIGCKRVQTGTSLTVHCSTHRNRPLLSPLRRLDKPRCNAYPERILTHRKVQVDLLCVVQK